MRSRHSVASFLSVANWSLNITAIFWPLNILLNLSTLKWCAWQDSCFLNFSTAFFQFLKPDEIKVSSLLLLLHLAESTKKICRHGWQKSCTYFIIPFKPRETFKPYGKKISVVVFVKGKTNLFRLVWYLLDFKFRLLCYNMIFFKRIVWSWISHLRKSKIRNVNMDSLIHSFQWEHKILQSIG